MSNASGSRVSPAQTYAKAIGILFLLSMIGGGFGELWIPSQIIVSGDAAATANNITSRSTLFRLGFAMYLLEAVCDIVLSLVFYMLLRPVRKDLALLAAFFGLVSTSVFAVAEYFYLAAAIPLGTAEYLKVFSPEQRNTLAMLAIRMYTLGSGIFMLFYGIASILRGLLIFRSGFLPRFLGVLLGLAGVGFIARNLVLVMAPRYASPLFLLPMFVAGVTMTFWFLVKGVDVVKWEERQALSTRSPVN